MPSLSTLRYFFLHRLHVNCFECLHPWNHSCNQFALSIFMTTFIYAVKLYSPLFILSSLLSRKLNIAKILSNIIRSSIFLGLNSSCTIFISCIFSKLLDGFYSHTLLFIPAFLASFVAIFVEKGARRKPLASYVLIHALETFHRMLNFRGINISIPYFDVLLSIFASAFIMFGYDSHIYVNEVVNFFPYVLFGFPEKIANYIYSLLFLGFRKKSIGNNFLDIIITILWGFLISSSVPIFRKLQRIYSPDIQEAKDSSNLSNNYLKNYILLPYIFFYKLIKILLSFFFPKTSQSHFSFISGLLAGFVFSLNCSPFISLYMFIKGFEVIILKYSRLFHFRRFPFLTEIIYSLSTATLFYAVVLEPYSIRSSYTSFCLNATGNAFLYFNTEYLSKFSPVNIGVLSLRNSKYPPDFILFNYFVDYF